MIQTLIKMMNEDINARLKADSEPQPINTTLSQTIAKPHVKRRVAVVECCWQCPFHIHDDQRDEAKWGISWCEKMNVEVFNAEEIIDKACPLPFA